MRIREDGDSWIDEPLGDDLGALGSYERRISTPDDDPITVKVYHGNYGELRIRIGRWKETTQ